VNKRALGTKRAYKSRKKTTCNKIEKSIDEIDQNTNNKESEVDEVNKDNENNYTGIKRKRRRIVKLKYMKNDKDPMKEDKFSISNLNLKSSVILNKKNQTALIGMLKSYGK